MQHCTFGRLSASAGRARLLAGRKRESQRNHKVLLTRHAAARWTPSCGSFVAHRDQQMESKKLSQNTKRFFSDVTSASLSLIRQLKVLLTPYTGNGWNWRKIELCCRNPSFANSLAFAGCRGLPMSTEAYRSSVRRHSRIVAGLRTEYQGFKTRFMRKRVAFVLTPCSLGSEGTGRTEAH